MVSKKSQFRKVQQFVTEQYNHITTTGALIVKPVASGFLVNNLKVEQQEQQWNVINETGSIIYRLHQRRIAILTAALISKRKFSKIVEAVAIDQQLDIYLSDKEFYNIRIKKNPDNVLYNIRLSRVENELSLLEDQIRELEKTCSLN